MSIHKNENALHQQIFSGLRFAPLEPLVRADRWVPRHPGRGEQVVLEESCLDARNCEADRLDCSVRQPARQHKYEEKNMITVKADIHTQVCFWKGFDDFK